MVFVKELAVMGQSAVEQFLYFLIAAAGLEKPVPAENTRRVGVDNKDRLVKRIQADRVGSFRTDALQGQQLLSQRRRWQR